MTDIVPAWARLNAEAAEAAGLRIRALFDADPGRFAAFSARLDDLLLDFSKTHLTAPALAALMDLASAAGVEAKRDAMFDGARINTTGTAPCCTWPCATAPTGPSWWTAWM